MTTGSIHNIQRCLTGFRSQASIVAAILMLATGQASAEVVLKLGDILIAEPSASSISVVDPATGVKTVISQGDLLEPPNSTVGVALALDGDIVVVNRRRGLIRVNPVTGTQSVLSEGGQFKDPWAIAIDRTTGYIFVADSGYNNDDPLINQAGKIIRVDPATGEQVVIASGTPCNFFPSNAACQNTTSAGSYLSHPYGIAIDYSLQPGTIVVGDMSSFNGKGAIIRIQAVPNGTQTLVWGPASAVPPPLVPQTAPLGCPMGIAVEPNGNILTTVFTYPLPSAPTFPPPAGTYYGCTPPGIFRIDLSSSTQSVVNTNAPPWQPNRTYSVGDVIRDQEDQPSYVHRVVTPGASQTSPPSWNSTLGGITTEMTVSWQNIGLGASWLIPFGVATEPAPTPTEPSRYNIIVGDEGHSMLFRLSTTGQFLPSPTPLATNLNNVTSVEVITFTPIGGFKRPAGPVRTNGQPAGTVFPPGTTQTTASLTTDVNATCRYGTGSGVEYASLPNTFATTGATEHATAVTGLTNGSSYAVYIRCSDEVGAVNMDDFVISFSVASSTPAISDFTGIENPLSENGVWDSPGSWGDLRKDNGAFAVGLNAQARRVTPVVAADQFSEITYDQDPGSSSWVGVTTRVQGANNGSGYLAIAYAGEVRFYRADDSSSLNFALLAFATVDIGEAPRRLRLESRGNTHQVYFNGSLVITHEASGTLYSTGQPGIAASVFGGPQVRILSFSGGSIASTDTSPPLLSNGSPFGTLPASTVQVSLSLTTDETASCRYGTTGGVLFGNMTAAFTTTGGTAHTTLVTGLTAGANYTFFVRCQDTAGNANPTDFPVTFTVARTGLVAAYGFDESSGTTTLDASGNSLTGTLTNVARTTAGKFGSALSFNGVNAMVTVADANALDLTTGMTLEAWVNPAASMTGTWRNVLIKERAAGEVYNLYANVDANVPAVYVVRAAQTGVPLDTRGQAAVPTNAWTHLAATHDGTTLRLFVNGTEVGSRAVSGALLTSTGPLRIGGNNVWGEFFQGTLDEIRIYNRALSASEIIADMNTSVGGTPTVTINQATGQADPSNVSPLNFTVVFSEPVSGFAAGDVSLSGTAGATTAVVTGGPTTYNVAISGMTGSGTVVATVGAGVAQDASGAGNSASTSVDNTMTYNASLLTVAVNQAAGQADPAKVAPINFTVVFSTAVSDFATGDVSLSGTAGATTAVVTGGPTVFNVAVSGMTGNGTVIVTVGAGVAQDAAGTANLPSTSTDNTVTYDGTAPTVTINQTSGQADPTLVSPINFAVVFSEPVVGFATGDVSLGGTAGATTATVTGGPTIFNVAVTGMTGNGTVTASVGAGVALDSAGNGNGASTSTDNSVTYDASTFPSLSISSVSVTEGTNATFTVALSAQSEQVVTVGYDTANGSAVAPGDYLARSGVLTFPIGTTTQEVTVPIVDDTLDEAVEQFTISLKNPSGATIASGQGIGTINDTDPPPSLSVNSPTVTEGDSGTVNVAFNVTLSVESGQTVTVNYTTADGTATSGDYTPTSGVLTFQPGTRTLQVLVPVVGDVLDESAETYTLTLSGASNATIATATGTGTINDNDALPSLSIEGVTVTEGHSGPTMANFRVSLSAVSGRQVTVNYATQNVTATAGSGDYTSVPTTPLIFAPGVTTHTVSVAVLGDALFETTETFRVNLSGAVNASLLTSQGTGTIQNDDIPPSLTISNPTVTESNSGSTNITFVVTLSAVSGTSTTVNFATADGTATAGSDYTARNGTLTIAAGNPSGNIAITRFGDTVPEANETLYVDLSGPTNATIAQSRGTGTINDNDGSVTVNSPSTAVTWTVGSARVITWTTSSSFTPGATFRVELSRDGGTTYELLAASVPNATSTSGSFNWTVTGPPTTQGRVRVTWTVNGRVTDISNNNFTIGP